MAKNLVLGFLPWFIYFFGAGYGNKGLELGIIGAIISILIVNLKDKKIKNILDLCTIFFFVFLLIVGVILKHPWFVKNAYWFSTLILAIIILLTILIKKPFTINYAKESVPEEFWDSELFIKTNYFISISWFFCMIVVTYVSYAYSGAISYVLQALSFAGVVFFSIKFPNWYSKKILGKNGVAQIKGISKVKYLHKVGYRELGDGKTIVMIPGTSMNMHHWDPKLLIDLAKKHRCVIIDVPGVCFSKQIKKLESIEKIGDTLIPFIQDISKKKVLLFGYSLGGFVAQYIACEIPQAIEKLVLISTSFGGADSILPTKQTIETLLDQSGTVEDRMIRLGSLMFTDKMIAKTIGEKIGDIYTSAAAEIIMIEEENIYLNKIAENWYIGEGVKNRLENLVIDTIIISGEKDLIVPTENSKLLASVIHQNNLKIFPDSGHGIIYQYPKEIASLVYSISS